MELPDGTRSEVQSLSREPLLECKHIEEDTCHYTYVTKFQSVSEQGRTGFNGLGTNLKTMHPSVLQNPTFSIHYRFVKRFSRKSAK